MEELDHRIDLHLAALILGLERTEYDPDEFDGVVYFSRQFSAVVLIFPSGRLVPIEFKDIAQAKSALEQLQEDLNGVGRVA